MTAYCVLGILEHAAQTGELIPVRAASVRPTKRRRRSLGDSSEEEKEEQPL